jgi:hypothetical protein
MAVELAAYDRGRRRTHPAETVTASRRTRVMRVRERQLRVLRRYSLTHAITSSSEVATTMRNEVVCRVMTRNPFGHPCCCWEV